MTKLFKERKRTKQEKEEEQHRQGVRQALFGEIPQREPSITERMEASEKQSAHVKRELLESEKSRVFKKMKTWSQELKAPHSFIDLDPATSPEGHSNAAPSDGPIAEPIADLEEQDVFGHGFDLEEADS